MEIENNFGLNGQLAMDGGYDHFLCLSRKCKERKAAKHKLRVEKRKLKNDALRADTESKRAETNIIRSSVPRTPTTGFRTPPFYHGPVQPPPSTNRGPVQTQQQVQKAGVGGNRNMMVIFGVLIVGGLIYGQMKKRPLPPLKQTVT